MPYGCCRIIHAFGVRLKLFSDQLLVLFLSLAEVPPCLKREFRPAEVPNSLWRYVFSRTCANWKISQVGVRKFRFVFCGTTAQRKFRLVFCGTTVCRFGAEAFDAQILIQRSRRITTFGRSERYPDRRTLDRDLTVFLVCSFGRSEQPI